MYRDDDKDIKKDLYSIGEMKAVTGLAVSTLRYYDELGLITPSYVDEDTGYRYFSNHHVWKIEIIKMYKKLGLSLNDIRLLQEKPDTELLLSFLDKNRNQIKQQIRQLQVTLSDLDWMDEQCEKQSQSEERGFCIKDLPERKVIYSKAVDQYDTKRLQKCLQKKAAHELDEQYSIRRGYGYILPNDCIEQGELSFLGQYIKLEEYLTFQEEELETLPAGKYLCMNVHLRAKNQDWMEQVKNTMEALNLKPRMIIANEVSLYLFAVEDTLYELEILF